MVRRVDFAVLFLTYLTYCLLRTARRSALVSLRGNFSSACQHLATCRTAGVSRVAGLCAICFLRVPDFGCKMVRRIDFSVLLLAHLAHGLLRTACLAALMSLRRNYRSAFCQRTALRAVGISGITLLRAVRFLRIPYHRLWMPARGPRNLYRQGLVLIIALVRPGVNRCRSRLHADTQRCLKIAVLPCPIGTVKYHICYLLALVRDTHGITRHIRRILRLVHRQLYFRRYRFIIVGIRRSKYYLILCRIAVGHGRLDIRCTPSESTCHLRIPSGQRRRISLTIAIHSLSAGQHGHSETVSIGNLCRRGNRLKIRLRLCHRHIDHHVKWHIITVARLIMHFIAVCPCLRNFVRIHP